MPSAVAVSATAAASSAMRWARLAAESRSIGRLPRQPLVQERQEHQEKCRCQRVQAKKRMQGRDREDEDRRPGGIEEGDHALVGDEGLDVGEGARSGGTVPATAREAKAHRGVDGRRTQLALEPVADPDQDAAPHAAQEAEHCRGSYREHGQPEQGAVGAAGQHTVEELHQVDGAHECQAG